MARLLACVLFLTTMSLTTPSATSAAGLTIRADLTHVDSGRGFTKWELLSRMAARSRARAASLHHPAPGGGGGGGYYSHPATATAAPGTVGEPSTEYLIHLSIGTPRLQHVALTLDTGSDLVWTQCKPCPDCFDQPSPLFDPSASKTLYAVSCADPLCGESFGGVAACYVRSHVCFYLDTYGDKSIAAGTMVRDTFTFGGGNKKAVVVPNLGFGCGLYNMGVFETNESGIAGFGRGPQSLPSQLRVGRFSYCFTSMLVEESSPVFLGTADDITAHATGPVQSTPMPRYGDGDPFYYLSFKGVTVGATRLPIDESAFARRRDDGTGGTVIDSGTGITTFPLAVHDQIKAAFVAQTRLPVVNASEVGGRLCFYVNGTRAEEKARVPKLVFHLAGADMELPRENYMYEDEEEGMMCLMINGAKGDSTIIGNFQQQNMHIVYDLNNNKLLFAPAQCDKL